MKFLMGLLFVTCLSFQSSALEFNSLAVGVESQAIGESLGKHLNTVFYWGLSSHSSLGLSLSYQLDEFSVFENDFGGSISNKYSCDYFSVLYERKVPVRKGSSGESVYFAFGGAWGERDNIFGQQGNSFYFIEPGIYSTHKIGKNLEFRWGAGIFLVMGEDQGEHQQGTPSQLNIDKFTSPKLHLKFKYNL